MLPGESRSGASEHAASNWCFDPTGCAHHVHGRANTDADTGSNTGSNAGTAADSLKRPHPGRRRTESSTAAAEEQMIIRNDGRGDEPRI